MNPDAFPRARSLLGAVALLLLFTAAPTTAAAADDRQLVYRTDPDGYITSWLLAGGFGWGGKTRKEALARDELGGAPEADPREGERAGKKRKWKLHVSPGLKVGLRGLMRPKSRSAAYAFARVVVPTQRAARILIGSDDGVRLWVNGALARERMVKRKHVADSELVPVELRAGVNRVLLKIDQTGGRWAFSARIVDERGAPMPDARIMLRTKDAPSPARIARAFAKAVKTKLVVRLRREADRSEATVRLRLAAAVPVVDEPLHVRVGHGSADEALATKLTHAALAGQTFEHRFTLDPTRPQRARVSVTDANGKLLFERKLGRAVQKGLLRLAFAAEEGIAAADPAKVPRASIDSVAYTLERGRALLEAGEGDGRYQKKLLEEAARDAKQLAKGVDPYGKKRQAFYRAYKSPYVDELQHYATYVPSGYSKKRKYPLVIALHGFKSTTMITLRRVLGSSITELSYADGDRKVPRFKEERFLVAAPRGYGNIAYRYIAEDDILRVIEEMKKAYNVDENRIYLTGLSMGGLGTMEVGLHYPDVFAGLISNCGAADTRIYESIEGYAPREWETDLIEGRSAVLWAENGLHVPFFIAHGIKDKINHPRNSRVLVSEYERLGYKIGSRFDPDLGHNVWDRTWKNGTIWTRFLQYRRDPYPKRVVFKSAHLRYTKAYWVRFEEWARYWKFARIDARIDSPANAITAKTTNLLRFRLDVSGKRLSRTRPLKVTIDGRVVHEGVWGEKEMVLARESETAPWRALAPRSSPGPSLKRPGLSGPIEDFKYVRQLLVYGTQDPAEEPVLRRAAVDAASYHSNSGIRLAIKRDADVTQEDVSGSHLHLFGTPKSNSWLRKIEGQLPVRVTSEGVFVGERLHKGPDLGFKLIFPNPLAPDKYVVVSAGVHAHAAGWANWLPLWIPDYIVFDQRTVSPRWGKILTGREVIDAGYFDRHWRLAK